MAQLFLSCHQILSLKKKPTAVLRIKQQISFPNNEDSSNSKSAPKYIYLSSLNSHPHSAQMQEPSIIDKIYPLKVEFADTMYRVIIHDSGLDFMYNPDRFIRWAVPSINREHSKKIIDYARENKEAIVITVPLNEALFYMKKLQRFSFTTKIVEA